MLDAATIVGSYVDGTPPATLADTHRELALHLGDFALYNKDNIDQRLAWFD